MNNYLNELFGIVPALRCTDVSTDSLTEIRLRVGKRAAYRHWDKGWVFGRTVDRASFDGVLLTLCGGNIFRHERTLPFGYFTDVLGGRCGVCGKLSYRGDVPYLESVTSLNIRVPAFIPCVSRAFVDHWIAGGKTGGAIVFGIPHSGKTTYLRSLAGLIAQGGTCVCVVDERREFSYEDYSDVANIDILSGYGKWLGIDICMRTMGAELIVCDELSVPDRDDRLRELADSGVSVITSAHADSVEQLRRSEWFRVACDSGIFRYYVHLRQGYEEEIGELCSIYC